MLSLEAGLLTGVAAFFGAMMNCRSCLLVRRPNPVLFTLAFGLILKGKVAGFYGR